MRDPSMTGFYDIRCIITSLLLDSHWPRFSPRPDLLVVPRSCWDDRGSSRCFFRHVIGSFSSLGLAVLCQLFTKTAICFSFSLITITEDMHSTWNSILTKAFQALPTWSLLRWLILLFAVSLSLVLRDFQSTTKGVKAPIVADLKPLTCLVLFNRIALR